MKLRGLFRRDLAVYDELLDPVRDSNLAAVLVGETKHSRDVRLGGFALHGRTAGAESYSDHDRDDGQGGVADEPQESFYLVHLDAPFGWVVGLTSRRSLADADETD